MVAAFHPLTLVRVLIQVGHEPIPPVAGVHWLTRRKKMYYPNAFQYMTHIRNVDGFAGLYRGLGPRIVHGLVNKTVSTVLVEQLNTRLEEVEVDEKGLLPLGAYLKETANISVARTAGYVVSYPFHVISMRMMVQFVGHETIYSDIISSIREIYREEGIAGFFKGLIPGLIGELLMFSVFRGLQYAINKYIPQEMGEVQDAKVVTSGISNLAASTLQHPFSVVSNVMSVNGAGLAVGSVPYTSWVDCWLQLGAERNRGSSLFGRQAPNYLAL